MNGGGSGSGVTAAAKIPCHLSGIDLSNPASPDQIDTSGHGDKGEDDIEVLHDHEAADDQGKVVKILREGQGDHHDLYPLNGVTPGGLHQLMQQLNLNGGEIVGDKRGDGLENSALCQEPGHGLKIGRLRGRVGERAGIFVDAKGKDGSLLR